jgi:hypothetical protein
MKPSKKDGWDGWDGQALRYTPLTHFLRGRPSFLLPTRQKPPEVAAMKMMSARQTQNDNDYMQTQSTVPESYRLYIPDLDNHVLIETGAEGVVIRATRDNMSDRRKATFIRHLAAQGYIPERYRWFSEPAGDAYFGVKWMAGVSEDEKEGGFPSLRKFCTRRNALYGCLFIVWLVVFVWAARHTFPAI